MGVVSRPRVFSEKKPHLASEREAGQHTNLDLRRLGKDEGKGRWCLGRFYWRLSALTCVCRRQSLSNG